MKYNRLFITALIALATLFSVVSCVKDDTDDLDVEVGEDDDINGNDLTFNVKADLSSGVACDMNIPVGELELTLLDIARDEVITATVDHTLVDGNSSFVLEEALPIGEYRIIMAKFYEESEATKGDNDTDDNRVERMVLACLQLFVEQHENYTIEDFNKTTINPGSGTEDDPIQIVCFMDLVILNYQRIHNETYADSQFYYKQMNDISFQQVSAYTGGFSGICTSESSPFVGYYDGDNHKITNLSVERFTSQSIDEEPDNEVAAAGLFGYVANGVIKNLTIEEPRIIGYDGVGAFIGAVVNIAGEVSAGTYMENCHLVNSESSVMKIYGRQYVGGLVGAVYNGATMFIYNCSNGVTASDASLGTRSYASGHLSGYVGGLIGGSASTGDGSNIAIVDSHNSMPISAPAAVAIGGLVGSCHEIYISGSTNSGNINAPYAVLGCGGLVGGSGDATILGSKNSGSILASSANGVGGIMGSSLYDYTTDDNGDKVPRFGNMVAVSTHNEGEVEGNTYVGGMCGASQIRVTRCFNTGSITAKDLTVDNYAGGMVGYAPVCTSIYSNNMGDVSGVLSGGICGEVYYYTLVANNNMGGITGTDSAGGLIGRGGRFGAINYSNNFGTVVGSNPNYTGGIAGQLGNVSKSSYVIGDYSDDALKCIIKLGYGLYKEYKGKESGKLSSFVAKIKRLKTEISTFKNGVETIKNLCTLCKSEDLSWTSDFYTELETYCNAEYDTAMEQAMSSSSAVRYQGAISTSLNPALLSLNNTINFVSTSLATDDQNDLLSENINDELAGLEERELKIMEFEEVLLSFAETILGVFKLTHSGATDKFVAGMAEIGLSILEDKVVDEDDTNGIAVTQVANYGAVNGRGIVGTSGYYLQLQHAVSAGAVYDSTYGVTDDSESRQKIGMNYCLCVGEMNVNASSDYKGNDRNSNIMSYGDGDGFSPAENFVNEDKYDYYKFDLGDVGSDSRWALASGYPFALPNSNRYVVNYDSSTLNKD
ncbi:MAG: hypothetical protein R3Y39_08095 [Rikenellaceae bacterium]